MELTLPPGHLVQQVQINPRMCTFFLKFVAPVLADVTSAQGAFSIDMDNCRIPLSDPAKGTFAGKFIIHSIEIGPGPLIRELAVLMGKETPAKLRREGVVPFQMVDGRIYHKDLELIFPDFTIRTYGSVGLDQTVAIMTEMPVPPKWLENNPLARGLERSDYPHPHRRNPAKTAARQVRDGATQPPVHQNGRQKYARRRPEQRPGPVVQTEIETNETNPPGHLRISSQRSAAHALPGDSVVRSGPGCRDGNVSAGQVSEDR